MPNIPRVVILGAGFGGIAAARTLAATVRSGAVNVTVVDRHASHVFTPLLYEAATGFVEHQQLGTSKLLDSGVTVDVPELIRPWGADFVQSSVEGIDWEKRQVLLHDKEPIAFDYVVIGLGAEVNYFGIAGLQENAYTLKSVRDADRLRQRVHDLLHKREEGTQKRMEIVIGGGGPTGVELAAELTLFLRQHIVKGHLNPEDYNISLVEAQPRLLGALNPKLSAAALSRLKTLGVHVYLDSAMKEAGYQKAVLVPRACKPGETADQLLCDFKKEGQMEIAADMVIWTGGIRGSAALEKLGVVLDARGKRIEVGPTFALPDKKNAFVIGDSALLMNPVTKQPVPWLAQAAVHEGEIVGRTIAARLSGGKDSSYVFPTFPVVVPLGGKYALAVVGGMTFVGFSGWVLKELATLRYFLSIMPFGLALRKWWHGALIYAGND